MKSAISNCGVSSAPRVVPAKGRGIFLVWACIAAILLPFVLVLNGCNGDDGTRQAHGTVEAFYNAIQAREFDSALQYLSEKVLQDEGAEAALDRLETLEVDLGPLRSFQIRRLEINTVYRGRFYIFDVDTTYSNARAAEVVTLFVDVAGADPKIVSRVVEPATSPPAALEVGGE